VPGAHGGTGTFQNSNWLVVPGSVPPPGNLAFFGKTVKVTTMLFAIADDVVPNWFGVAVPSGITDFTKAHVFFHPTTAQAGYVDADYKTKSGLWPHLFYYMERLGYQLDGAARNQVLIMPFLTEAAKDAGMLPAHWQEIIPDILTGVRDAVTGSSGGSPVTLAAMAVSSYSAGIIYSDSFRRHATGLSTMLEEVWDFDGHISSYQSISQNLKNTAGCRVIQYDQIPSNDLVSFHVPRPRWVDYVQPPQSGGQVHGLIRDFMFMHGASISGVGAEIVPPGTGTADTGTATHTATHTATGTSTQTASATATATATGTSTSSATSTGTATATATGTTTTTAPPFPPTIPVAPARPAEPSAPPVPVPVVQWAGTPKCGCNGPALVAAVSSVATVAQTALTAISAIPARRRT
jgi:hypothetical protein